MGVFKNELERLNMNVFSRIYRDIYFTIYPWYIIARLRIIRGMNWNAIDCLVELVCTLNNNDVESICRLYIQRLYPNMCLAAMQYVREVLREYPTRIKRKIARKSIKKVAYERLSCYLTPDEESR